MNLMIDAGIDLGTTNSAIARLAGATPRLLADEAGDVLLPSAIHVDAQGDPAQER